MSASPWKTFPLHVPDDGAIVDVRRLGFLPDAPITCKWVLTDLTFHVMDSPLADYDAQIPWYMVIEWAPTV